jgi:CheY-like chemotaxis protein
MASTALLLSDDLLFISRITGTARALGVDIKSARNMTELLALAAASPPTCVLLDLQNPGLDISATVQALKKTGSPRLIGYGSHVDAATLKAARDAGCDIVLPRSRFVEELPTQLAHWFQIG